jgi:hypothetical protein
VEMQRVAVIPDTGRSLMILKLKRN